MGVRKKLNADRCESKSLRPLRFETDLATFRGTNDNRKRDVRMKNFSLKPTQKNAIELLRTNPIGRNNNLFQFIKLLGNIRESCTIAINGEWGSGKTFFVQQAKLILDALNDTSTLSPEIRAEIKSLCRQLPSEIECYATVYYDAWMYDNDEDPVLSLVHATITSNQTDFSPSRKRSIINGAAALANVLTEHSVGEVLKEAAGKDCLASFKTSDDIRKMVEEFIDSLVYEHGNRLVFFIDELDRCRPDYAIRFMERIKHYFDDERITFVFSVSLSQLQATVKKYYGAEFDASRYLDKFFDLRVSLPQPDIERFMQQRLGLGDYTVTETVCIAAAKHYRLSLRELERFARLVKICALPVAQNVNTGFGEANARAFSVSYILPIMLILQMTDVQAYNEFISGRNPAPLTDILQWPQVSLDYSFLIGKDEELDSDNTIIVYKDATSSGVSVQARLKEVYQAFFLKSLYRHYEETNIGIMKISDRTRTYLDETISMLSQLSNYQYE